MSTESNFCLGGGTMHSQNGIRTYGYCYLVAFACCSRSYSSVTTSLVNSEEVCFAADGVYVDVIRCFMRDRSITVEHVPRGANNVAHRVAQFSLRYSNVHFWDDSGVPWLLDAFMNDVVVTRIG